MLNKRGYIQKYGYNADAHSRFGLDYSATRKEFTPLPIPGQEPPAHHILHNLPANAIREESKNYLGSSIYRVNLPSDKAADRYLSVVDELECNIIENEDGTYDIDLGTNSLETFRVCVDEDGNGSYDSRFMNVEHIEKAYEHAYGVQTPAVEAEKASDELVDAPEVEPLHEVNGVIVDPKTGMSVHMSFDEPVKEEPIKDNQADELDKSEERAAAVDFLEIPADGSEPEVHLP